MSAEQVHQLFPAEVATEQGVVHGRVRTMLYTTDVETRHVIIDADGKIVEDVIVDDYQINGTGVNLTLADGREMVVTQAQGCSGCGSSFSASTAAALLASY